MDEIIVFFGKIFRLVTNYIHLQSLSLNQFNQLHLVNNYLKSFVYILNSYLLQSHIQGNQHPIHRQVHLLFTLFSKILVSFANTQIQFASYACEFFLFLELRLFIHPKLANSTMGLLEQLLKMEHLMKLLTRLLDLKPLYILLKLMSDLLLLFQGYFNILLVSRTYHR